jgi:hypothetical protein
MPAQIFSASQTEILAPFLEKYQNASTKDKVRIVTEAVKAITKVEKEMGNKITDGDKHDLQQVSVFISVKEILRLINFGENNQLAQKQVSPRNHKGKVPHDESN